MKLVINLHVSPWELSSPGPMTHSALIHHCQQQQPVLFGSSAPFCPPTFPYTLPPISILSYWAGGGHRMLGDELAVFNQELMMIAPPPRTPFTGVFRIWSSQAFIFAVFTDVGWHTCLDNGAPPCAAKMLIYANRSHLFCSCSPCAASAPLSLALCASQTVCLRLPGGMWLQVFWW